MNILYLVKHYPCLSQTFVQNEVAALTSRGCAVHVVSAIDLKTAIDLEPVMASRVMYLQYGYLYRHGASADSLTDEDVARTARATLVTDRHPVPHAQRRRLWNILSALEIDSGVRARGFLDALSVVVLARACATDHLHCDFAEDNVKLAFIVSQATGIPFTFKMRAYDIFAEPQRDLATWAAAADRIFTISRYNRDYICRHWGVAPEKVVVIHDGVSLEQTRPVASYAHRPFRIVSVSRLVEKKGVPVLLDACRLLKSRVAFRCDIFGDGPMLAVLQARVADLDLDGWVTLHGGRAHADVLAALESASVFVLACIEAGNGDRDGTPNSLLEAMARGIPVVSTRLSGIPEIVETEVAGLLAPPNDARALAEAIVRIADDAELAESIRREGQRQVATRFTIDRTVDEFLRWVTPQPVGHG